jgi:hypothetical protein
MKIEIKNDLESNQYKKNIGLLRDFNFIFFFLFFKK